MSVRISIMLLFVHLLLLLLILFFSKFKLLLLLIYYNMYTPLEKHATTISYIHSHDG